jgi:hypothetical protein
MAAGGKVLTAMKITYDYLGLNESKVVLLFTPNPTEYT